MYIYIINKIYNSAVYYWNFINYYNIDFTFFFFNLYYYYIFLLNYLLSTSWMLVLNSINNFWYLINNIFIKLNYINIKLNYINIKLNYNFYNLIKFNNHYNTYNKYKFLQQNYNKLKVIANSINLIFYLHNYWVRFFISFNFIIFKYLKMKFIKINLITSLIKYKKNITIRPNLIVWLNTLNSYYFLLVNYSFKNLYYNIGYINYIIIILLFIQFNNIIKLFNNYFLFYYSYIYKKYYIYIYNNIISNLNYINIYIYKNYINYFLITNLIIKTNIIINTACYPSSYILNLSIKFLLYLLNSNICLKVNFSLYTQLIRFEYLFLNLIINQLLYYNLYFTSFFFIREFVEIVYWILKIKDFNILYTFIQRILNALIIWDHKAFFLFLFSMFQVYFYSYFYWLNIIGIKIIIRGKVAVGGNSRRRKLILNVNKVSIMQLNYKIYSFNKLLNTKTGALGFRIVVLYN